MIIVAMSNNVRNALSKARQVANLKLDETREVLRSGGDDGLWRSHLADGTVVEITLVQHCPLTQAYVMEL